MIRWFHVEPQPSGFRFLHDEIGDALHGIGHMRVASGYFGPCINVGGGSAGEGTDYNFTDNIINLSPIQSAHPSPAFSLQYDQGPNADNGLGAPSSWNGTDFIFTEPTLSFGTRSAINNAYYGFDFDKAHTIIMVFKMNATAAGTVQIFEITQATRTRIGAQLSSGTLFYYVENTGLSIARRSFGSFTDVTNTKMWVFQKDAGYAASGLNVFINDMITPLAATPSLDGLAGTGFNPDRIGYASVNFTSFSSFTYEAHIFNKALSQAERETAKTILEQYYTFS